MHKKEIRELSDEQLLTSLQEKLDCERKASHLVLLHLVEIQVRKLYAKRGYDSLFWMLIKHFHLSESAANQRLKALELIREVPRAEECLLRGEVNLSTLAMAQRQIQQEEKCTRKLIGLEAKEEIVAVIARKTLREAERELMRLLPETSTAPKTCERRVSQDAVRVSVTLPDSVRSKLVRLKEIWAHVNPSMDLAELIDRAADLALAAADPALRKPSKPKLQCATEPETHLLSPRKTYYGKSLDHALWGRADSQCEYLDQETGRRCDSRFGLERDHRIPLAKGGSNGISNLRLLCRAHNNLEARRQFGDEKIDREIRRRMGKDHARE